MDDIIEKLEFVSESLGHGLCGQAAAEIKRLRQENATECSANRRLRDQVTELQRANAALAKALDHHRADDQAWRDANAEADKKTACEIGMLRDQLRAARNRNAELRDNLAAVSQRAANAEAALCDDDIGAGCGLSSDTTLGCRTRGTE